LRTVGVVSDVSKRGGACVCVCVCVRGHVEVLTVTLDESAPAYLAPDLRDGLSGVLKGPAEE